MSSSRVLLRMMFLGMAGLGLIALLLGRYGSMSPDDPRLGRRSPAYPRYYWMNICKFYQEPQPTYILDAETGAVRTFPLSATEDLDLLGCSPWRDGQGQFHLVGVWRGSSETPHLLRCTLPDGRVLDRVELQPLPSTSPCWSPDASDRILYVAGDGRLYHYWLPETRDRRTPWEAMPPRPLRWEIDPPGDSAVYFQDLCWTSESILGGRLLVALNLRENARRAYRGPQLWWLQLSPDGTSIVAAGRLLRPDGDDAPSQTIEERLPSVGTARDGTALFAYLTRASGESTWALWVATLMADATSGAPRVPTTGGMRKVAEGCEAVVPVFSADGRWVYATRRNARSESLLERFAVAPTVDDLSADRRAKFGHMSSDTDP